MVRGLTAIDMRTAAAQALVAWRRELFADLGGEDNCSAQEKVIVELATRTRLYVESLDQWIMEQRSLVNYKRRCVLPVVLQRQTLADALARYMGQLGLERKAKPALDLQTYLRLKDEVATNQQPTPEKGEPNE